MNGSPRCISGADFLKKNLSACIDRIKTLVYYLTSALVKTFLTVGKEVNKFLEYDNNIPIYLQVIDRIKKDIIQGRLPMGEKLPSTRELALQYNINPNTAARIYKEMEQQKMCFTKRGLGTFVTEDPEIFNAMREDMARKRLDSFISDMKALGYTKEELIEAISQNFL